MSQLIITGYYRLQYFTKCYYRILLLYMFLYVKIDYYWLHYGTLIAKGLQYVT